MVAIQSGVPSAAQAVADPNGDGSPEEALTLVGCPSATICEAIGATTSIGPPFTFEALTAAVEIDDGVPGSLVPGDQPLVHAINGMTCIPAACEAVGRGSVAESGGGVTIPMDGDVLQAAMVAPAADVDAAACAPGVTSLSSCALLTDIPGEGDPGVVVQGGNGSSSPVLYSVGGVGLACATGSSCDLLVIGSTSKVWLDPLAIAPATEAITAGRMVALPLTPVGAPVCVSASSCLMIGHQAGHWAIEQFGAAVPAAAPHIGWARVRGTTVSLPISCLQPCAARIALTTRAAHAVRLAHAARLTIPAPGTRTVTLRLDRGRSPRAARRRTTPGAAHRARHAHPVARCAVHCPAAADVPRSVGRQVLPPLPEHPERRPEGALGRLLVE